VTGNPSEHKGDPTDTQRLLEQAQQKLRDAVPAAERVLRETAGDNSEGARLRRRAARIVLRYGRAS